MYVTYESLFTLILVIVAIVELVIEVLDRIKK